MRNSRVLPDREALSSQRVRDMTICPPRSDNRRFPDALPQIIAKRRARETLTDGPARVGARYTVLWKIGSIPVGGVAEVVEFDEACDLAWINITGVT